MFNFSSSDSCPSLYIYTSDSIWHFASFGASSAVLKPRDLNRDKLLSFVGLSSNTESSAELYVRNINVNTNISNKPNS